MSISSLLTGLAVSHSNFKGSRQLSQGGPTDDATGHDHALLRDYDVAVWWSGKMKNKSCAAMVFSQ